jgi:hypothetical protein
MPKRFSKNKFNIEQLEPRLLFSADLQAVPFDVGFTDNIIFDSSPVLETSLVPGSIESRTTVSEEHQRHELIFIDAGVPDYQQLVNDLSATHTKGQQVDVIVLDSGRNGIQQISEALARYQDIDAVHVVSHGMDGAVQLGNTFLNSVNIDYYADSIEDWSKALTGKADLLFYGCDLAAGEEGRSLINSLTFLTGSDVAASDDLTGFAEFGGDWKLEHSVGIIETNIIANNQLQQNWRHVLAVTVDSSSSGSTADQLSVTVSHTTSGTNRLMLVGVSMQPEGASVSSVKYNGADLTLVGAEENSAGKARVEIWQLIAPDTGIHDVVVNLTDTGHKGVIVGVMTFNGVNQTTPTLTFSSASGDSTDATITVASQTDDLVFGVVQSHKGAAASPDPQQTEYWDIAINNANGSGTTEAGDTSVTTSWVVNDEKWSAATVSVQADTNSNEMVSLSAVQDTYITVKSPDNNNGLSSDLIIDRETTDLHRALLQFDFSSIPAGAVINSATLKMEATGIDGQIIIDVYEITEAWSEGAGNSEAANWNERMTGTNWTTPGGTFDSTAVDSLNTNSTGQHTWDLTSLTQDWLTGTKVNNGLVVASPDGGGNRTVTYDSREGTTPPVLEINYTLLSAPVNSTTGNSQQNADVATDATGNYVVVWQSELQDGDGWGIYARRFDASGSPLANEFLVNTTTDYNQTEPRIAMDDAGNFVITWASEGQDGDSATETNIYASVYDATGTLVRGEFLVNQTTADNQITPSLAMDKLTGEFMIAWAGIDPVDSDWDIYARRYDVTGAALDNEITVNSTTAGDQIDPDVDVDTSAEFGVVWTGFGQDGDLISDGNIYIQNYRTGGETRGGENLMNTTTAGHQHSPALTKEDDGDYSIVWVSEGQDGDGAGIFADSFAFGGSGSNNYGEIQVNETVSGDQTSPDIAVEPLGNIVITWQSTGQDGDGPAETNVYARPIGFANTTIEPVSSEFLVNTTASGDQQRPAVAADNDDDFVIAWSGNGPGDTDGIFARVFEDMLTNSRPEISLAKPEANYTENDPPGQQSVLVKVLP